MNSTVTDGNQPYRLPGACASLISTVEAGCRYGSVAPSSSTARQFGAAIVLGYMKALDWLWPTSDGWIRHEGTKRRISAS